MTTSTLTLPTAQELRDEANAFAVEQRQQLVAELCRVMDMIAGWPR